MFSISINYSSQKSILFPCAFCLFMLCRMCFILKYNFILTFSILTTIFCFVSIVNEKAKKIIILYLYNVNFLVSMSPPPPPPPSFFSLCLYVCTSLGPLEIHECLPFQGHKSAHNSILSLNVKLKSKYDR